MDKASKAIRRSGVRLRSLSSGHGDLQMVISQLGEVRSSFKAFALAQATATEDLLRWAGGSSNGSGSGSQENRAIEETFAHLAELSVLWSEVQKDFADQLKEYRTQYELILEGEKHVTDAREVLSLREQREGKLRRDLKRASKKAPLEEVCMLKEKLGQAERSRDLAHLDVVERVGENEAVKMIRVKEGLLKLGSAYCDLAQKCLVIFSAHRDIASQLPDVHDRDLHGVKYTGAGAASRCVQEAKERVRSFRRSSTSPPKPPPPPHPSDPPPPYTPTTPRYPPTAPSHPHPPITHSPSLPEDPTPPSLPHPSPHSNSAPNLADEVAGTVSRPPQHATFTTRERSEITEQSALSPELARPARLPHVHHRDLDLHDDLTTPPYDPYYEWLPETGAGNGDNECTARNESATTNVNSAGSAKAAPNVNNNPGIYPNLNGYRDVTPPPGPQPPPASVRPRVGRNPFWEDSEEEGVEEEEREEAGGVTSLSGALRKTAIR